MCQVCLSEAQNWVYQSLGMLFTIATFLALFLEEHNGERNVNVHHTKLAFLRKLLQMLDSILGIQLVLPHPFKNDGILSEGRPSQ